MLTGEGDGDDGWPERRYGNRVRRRLPPAKTQVHPSLQPSMNPTSSLIMVEDAPRTSLSPSLVSFTERQKRWMQDSLASGIQYHSEGGRSASGERRRGADTD